jgi:hypothetical protein
VVSLRPRFSCSSPVRCPSPCSRAVFFRSGVAAPLFSAPLVFPPGRPECSLRRSATSARMGEAGAAGSEPISACPRRRYLAHDHGGADPLSCSLDAVRRQLQGLVEWHVLRHPLSRHRVGSMRRLRGVVSSHRGLPAGRWRCRPEAGRMAGADSVDGQLPAVQVGGTASLSGISMTARLARP